MRLRLYVLIFVLICLWATPGVVGSAPKKPVTVTELANYKGSDRQQILEEGAKKEGKLTFYTIATSFESFVNLFQKKYPYIKVDSWRAGSATLVPKVMEEYQSGTRMVDVIEASQSSELALEAVGIFQPFYSPQATNLIEGAVKEAPGGGALAAACRMNPLGIGYNTKLIAKEQLPKTYQDLLDPKWKGEIPLSGANTGVEFIGAIYTTFGEDFVKRLAAQRFRVHMASGQAVLSMILNGEYAFSPNVYLSHISPNKRKGAPVDWMALDPAYATVGQITLTKQAAHPHAALLFIDFMLSRESADIYKTMDQVSTRTDVTAGKRTYKIFFGPKSVDDTAKWEGIFNRLFVKID